jgi:hypothetical protein
MTLWRSSHQPMSSWLRMGFSFHHCSVAPLQTQNAQQLRKGTREKAMLFSLKISRVRHGGNRDRGCQPAERVCCV